VVAGPPGVGKSALADWLVDAARGWRVLAVRATPGRQSFAFSGLVELFRSAPDVLDAAARARPLVVGDERNEAYDAPARDPLAVGVPLLRFLSGLAADEPILLLVDDAHWLDRASLEMLAFVAARDEGDPIAVVLTSRDEDPVIPGECPFPVIRLEGLPEPVALALIGDRMAPEVARQVVEAAAGNPLAILAACDLLTDEQRRGVMPLAGPLPVPRELERVYAARLDGVAAEMRLVLLVVAIDERLERPLAVEICRVLGVTDPEQTIEQAVDMRLLETRARHLVPAHPLVASAVHQAASVPTRRRVHRAVAERLRRDGDLERRAWHLARASDGPDESVAAMLDDAGRRALRRGDAHAAGACFLRASELSPDAGTRAERLGAAGDALSATGRTHDALQAYDAALALVDDPAARVALLVRRSLPGAMTGSVTALADDIEREIDSMRVADPASAGLLAVYAAFPAFTAALLPRAHRLLVTARQLVPRFEGPTELVASGLEASVAAFLGDPWSAAPVLGRIADTPGVSEMGAFASYLANVLSLVDDFDRATGLIDVVVDTWRGRAAPGSLTYPLGVRAEMRVRAGAFMDARADADEAIQLARAASRPVALGYGLCALARAEASLGYVDVARHAAQEAVELADRHDIGFVRFAATGARGFVELAANEPDAALPYLEHAAAIADAQTIRLWSVVPWGPDLVEAYVRTERFTAACELVERLAREAGPTPSASAHAVLERCRGLVADDRQFDEHFEVALGVHATVPMPFEEARTHASYADRLRAVRRRKDATDQLEQALELLRELRAPGWANTGPVDPCEPGSSGDDHLRSLTPREYQVARAVAAGRTNKDAAAELFISTRTLEHHLANVYRKLGVRSRSQLVRLFTRTRGAPRYP
jgi:DNA-binding CsgD family transcriptional regulator